MAVLLLHYPLNMNANNINNINHDIDPNPNPNPYALHFLFDALPNRPPQSSPGRIRPLTCTTNTQALLVLSLCLDELVS